MSLTVKAFLYRRSWKEEPVEIRRFSVDQEVSSNYSYLVQKIAQVFPSVPAEDVVLSWADADGDHIEISSDEELLEALDHFDGSIFKLHLRKRERSCPFYCQLPVSCGPPCHPPQGPTAPSKTEGDEEMEEESGTKSEEPSQVSGAASSEQPGQEAKPQGRSGPHHAGVVCDGCGSGIYGIRFKCLVCPDYDLCSSCEKKGEHVVHNMVIISEPHSYNPWGFLGPRAHCGGGPWRGRGRGRGNRCGGRRGRSWGPWPYFLQQFLGGGQWGQEGGPQGCCGEQQTPQEKLTAQGKSEQMETEQTPQSAEDAQLEKEQRQSYLQDIGEAVSGFLRPFGVKVDVGVVDEAQTSQKEADTDPAPEPSSKVPSGYQGDALYPTLDAAGADATTTGEAEVDAVETAVTKLTGMGFDNEGGWLTELVRTKGGDIGKVLDALNPSQND